LTDEISQAFANVNNALCYVLNGGEPNASSVTTNTSSVPSASAGKGKIENGWSKVFRVRTYHVNLREAEKETLEHMVKEVRKWCPDHKPIWTLVEVKGLSDERLRIEVEVEAWLG
jgi:enamine deaminase RidA (YjgF/YER057c/UK114 family)